MKHLLAVGALVASAATAALVQPAQADPPGNAHGVSRSTGADSKAEQKAVRAYWTAERMRTAVPRGPVVPTGKPSGNAKPTNPGGSTGDGSLGSVWSPGQKTVGKVFFTLGGANYVCSGNAVDWSEDGTTSTSLVSTAGHCVNDGGTVFATNFMFIPAYDATRSRTAQPLGSYVATELATSAQWIAQGANKWDYDIAFARVGTGDVDTDKDGTKTDETLAQNAGSTDIAFQAAEPGTAGLDYSIDVHSFGYPAARPYDGTKLVSCWGTTSSDYVGGSGDYRLACNMTGGSSGGPWILDSAEGGVGNTQVSVNSFGYRGEKNAMYGPLLGPTARGVYVAARS